MSARNAGELPINIQSVDIDAHMMKRVTKRSEYLEKENCTGNIR
jgi:hypothetical protein